MPSGPADDVGRLHLFVILTNPCRGNYQLIVSLSSIKPNVRHDPTCEMQVGEHEFITKPSFVLYSRANTAAHNSITINIMAKNYVLKNDVDDQLFKKICDGINSSPRVPRWIRTYYNENKDR